MRCQVTLSFVLIAGCSAAPNAPPSRRTTLNAAFADHGRAATGGIAHHVEGPAKELEFLIPFPDDVAVWVDQGNNQQPTHIDEMNCYAFDFSVPEGTPVCASADGLVIYVKQDATEPTGNWQENNQVVLRHRDGTFTIYCHLQKDSVCVVGGQEVIAGAVIAASGNTGSSAGPHLHFCRLVDWGRGPSLPCRFNDVVGSGKLVAGQRIGVKVDRLRSITEEISR